MILGIYSIIIFLGIIQSLFLAVIILRIKKGNRKANQMLALFLICLSINLANIFLFRTNFYLYFAHLVKLAVHIQLLIGPLVFFYVKILTSVDFHFKKQDLLHLLPFGIGFLFVFSFYIKGNLYKSFYIIRLLSNDLYITERLEQLFLLGFAFIHVWTYLFMVRYMIYRHENRIKEYFSSINEVNLSWMKYLTNVFLFIYSIYVVVYLLLLDSLNINTFYCIIGVLGSIGIFSLGYRGMLHPEIFYATEKLELIKPEKPLISREDAQKYLARLSEIMEEGKLFKDPNLNLSDLAKKLAIPRTYLSQIINEHTGMNFFDFINGYRVEAVKLYLIDPEKDHLTLAALANEAGFQSRASFNRIFKKAVQMTPSEYKNYTLNHLDSPHNTIR